jgi:uncharacterized protein (TIGR00297 family)
MRFTGTCAASRKLMTETYILADVLWAGPGAWSLMAWRTLPTLGITVAFGLVAWGMRGVTARGALIGALLTFVITISSGAGGFLTVLAVFVITLFATRFGLHRKLAAGTAERREGRRGSQVLANLGAAGIVATPAIFYSRTAPLFLAAMTAALCEAAADTVSSEIGQVAGRRAYLITNLNSVSAGTDGGVTAQGTIAGAVAALIVAGVASGFAVIPSGWLVPVVLCGFAGMLFDSLLGATLQSPGRLGNDAVNFLSTTFAAAVTLGYGLLLMS